MPLGIFWKRKH